MPTLQEIIQADYLDPPEASFYRLNPQSVTHNLNTPIAWDSVDKDTFGCYSGAFPSRIIVPSGKGIYKARASANVHFELRSDYVRLVAMIAKNGNAGVGLPHSTEEARSEYGCAGQLGVHTGKWIDVVPGDYFELIVQQVNTSGTPANTVGAGLATYLCVEFRRKPVEEV